MVYEATNIHDKWTAQEHYQGRELTERKLPFNDNSLYRQDYPEWPLPPQTRHRSGPLIPLGDKTGVSTFQAEYPPWETPKHGRRAPEPIPSSMPLYSTTTYGTEFPGKSAKTVPFREPQRQWPERPFNGNTTYGNHFPPKSVNVNKHQPEKPPNSEPFKGKSSYNADYLGPHAPAPMRAPNRDRPMPMRKFQATTTTGEAFKGFQLPKQRCHLGVEAVGDRFHILIPRTKTWPAVGTHIFSTHRNNQREMCILVLYGDSTTASENKMLGQFDMINIPPAPKQVPAMEVTFRVDVRGKLTAEARDLDTERHKLWTAQGGAIVVK
mmetsp:Transcript_15123/g.20870  ORF Transcript_15123/g.20870 Transcript_15123/m.20870 type:complete len:323 (-) Transcript_15123:174-1142(-)|eukprot:CAMPEP_0196583096 /NCGR_PEP_ID=MMETSP1081-20130531/41972_1 /TAXON_ID=36882 /ORGANISM="Pyramimonas amylifera, Strain CCMP720" /LENGTH=322 /DNA_ID=CAMNT_0041903867 /DNA_START=180 /DNA_END=1148 /DNA_ORIENTATION=+